MSEKSTPPRGRLREHVAEEIRVLLARKRISATELARRTGIKQSTMSRRMTGETAFDMDDLELIADALGVEVTDLMPKRITAGGGTAREGEPSVFKDVYRAIVQTDDDRPAEPGKPFSPRRTDSVRPVSAIPGRSRRPQPVRPGVRRKGR